MYMKVCTTFLRRCNQARSISIQTIPARFFFERKRKRQVLEEDDEISEDEMAKLKTEMDGFPTDFVLPKDTTGTSMCMTFII